MPVDWSKYPKDWRDISANIKARSGGQCECAGECGLHDGQDLYEPVAHRCVERHGFSAKFANGTVILTTAHLNHDTQDSRPENLKAMCQRCHLRYDTKIHAQHSAITRKNKKLGEKT